MSSGSAVGSARRIDWVDALRAMAMFFVILGHQIHDVTGYFVFTSPIKLPLFFMITGFVFNYGRTDTGAFFKNLFFKLVVPWLCLTVPIYFFQIPSRGFAIVPKAVYMILAGKIGWYMPALILGEILWFFTCKYGKSPLRISLTAAAVCCLGILAGHFHLLDFAMFNRAMIAQYYILLGYLYKTFHDRIARLSWRTLLPAAAVYLLLGCVSLQIWPHSRMDIHNNFYHNYPLCFTMITLGCFTVFAMAEKLCGEGRVRIPRVVRFLGQSTIVYYLLHTRNIRLLLRGLALLHIELPFPALVCVKVLFAYVMCGLETLLLLRFLPWAIGRKKGTGACLR